ncbi:hypothetical protein BDQ12DRAFT_668382 [Crucibulum laeve]|uniref:Uncharacterized protein n=1 Tax=Crucibulum laeve TaxID=68775 RepID=A0A5C3LRG8_9AGAR|nr:hypothetical protein BDQ12DRAFT_668382 [Crucibulum laeve]
MPKLNRHNSLHPSNSMQQRKESTSNGKKVMEGSIELTGILLTTLQDAARLSPVPGLSDAASLALGILKMVETAQGNSEAFKKLAKDACGLVYTVVCSVQEMQYKKETIDKSLFDNTDELVKNLHSIQKFAEKEGRRGKLMRLLRYQSDMGKIQGYREMLRHSLDIFGLQSNISMRDSVARMMEQQERIIADMQRRRQEEERAQAPKEQERQTDTSKSSSGSSAGPENSRSSTSSSAPSSIATPALPKLRTAFGNIQLHSPTGASTFTSIAGDNIDNNNSSTVTNTNSGNTTSTTITGAYNDSSYRGYGLRMIEKQGQLNDEQPSIN